MVCGGSVVRFTVVSCFLMGMGLRLERFRFLCKGGRDSGVPGEKMMVRGHCSVGVWSGL